jgi:hypothetical protein
MTSVLDATPTPTSAGHSEATIVACVLADLCGPLGINDLRGDDDLRRRVARALERHTHGYFLAWQDRAEMGHWSVKWDCARRFAERLYPRLPGVQALPDVYRAQFGDHRETS